MTQELQNIVKSQQVDTNSQISIREQILQIALYDEQKANAFYTAVVEKFGNIRPFSNIQNAETKHIEELDYIIKKYQITPIENDLKLQAPNSIVESLELGISAEIANINLYEYLLNYTQDDDVKDLFFRLQANSFNNHLPALRENLKKAYETSSSIEQKPDNEIFEKINEFSESFKKISSGEANPEEIATIFKNVNLSLLGGLAFGAIATTAFTEFLKEQKED